jgi:hypothetical protein
MLLEKLGDVLPALWMAGVMIWEGRSPASWTMNSPRSVSTTRIPAASRAA